MFWNATPSFQEFQRRLQNPKYVQTVQANYRAHGRSGDAFDTLSGFRDYFCVSDEDKQDMTQGVGNMIADTKARLAGQQRYNKLKQFQDKHRDGLGFGVKKTLFFGVKTPFTNANVVREPLTGRYLTSDGAEYAQEFEAARAQNQLDETGKRYTEAVERGDLPSAFEVRDEDGNYALVEDLGVKPGVHVTEKGKQQQLAGLVNTRKSVEEQYNALYRKLEEDFKRSAPFSLNTHSQYGIDDNDMRLQAYLNSNAQYRRLKAQLHQLDNAIRVGEEAVKGRAEERYVKNAKGMLGYAYRDLKSFGASALRGLWNAVSDVSTWDMGLQDLQDNMTLYTTVKKARQKGYKNLNSEERQMLDVAAKTGAYTAENQQYLGRGYKAGNVTGESLPFMVEMALNPASGLGEAVMSKYMRNAIAKYGKEAVRKEAWKYVTKKCGYRIAGDVLGAALMTGTTGSARTLADTYDRLTGDIKSTYDSKGKIVYDGTENEEKGILKAYLKAFGATAIENHSEFVGEYFNPLLKGVGTLTMKGWKKVNAKSANAFLDNLKDMGSTSTAKWLGNLFDKTQWHGTIAEYAEEVVGNIENALLVGDSTLDTKEGTGVFNLDQNIDTFLGVSLMGGFFSTLKTGAYVRDKVKGERKILMQQSLDLDNSIRYALGADPRLADKWKEWRVALAQGTDEEKKQALKEISENTNGNIKKAMYDYSANAQKLAGMDKATQGAIEDGTITPEQAQRDADIEQAHEEGLAAEGTARHDIQQEHQLRENSLARMLGISAEQLDRMEDEDIESMTGQNDALDTAIYDYQTSRERYQGVIDRATDEVEQAGIDAAHQIDLYTDHSTGQIRPCVIKGNNGKEDYQGYIVNGNIATHPDGAIDVSGSDKMILYFDPETGKIEHGDASTFASLGESADATVARQQAIDEAKQQAAQAQSRDIDRGVGEDGNVSEAMPTFPQSSDQEERNAADFDIGQVVNAETGEVIPVSFEELAEGENAYLTGGRPDGKTKDRLKVTIVDAEGNVTNRMMKRGNVQVDGRMSAEDFRNAYEEAVSSRIAPEADMNGPENNVDEEGVVAGGAAPSADTAATSGEEGAASEPAVRDKNGNPIYDKMPISATIADLYDGALDDAEIDGFVSAQIAEAEKAVEKMEKKKPKVGTDKAKYLADKKAWEEGLQEAQRKVQYWQDVKAEVDKITTPEDARGYEEELNGDAAQAAYRNGSDAASYGVREVTAEFMQSGDVKITPESYRKETGFGAAEQRAMVGKISKGGKSIDKLAEDLEVFDRENYNGMYFGGDSSVAKDAILDYLSSPDSRKGVKKMQSEAEREYVEAYEAERDRYYQEKYHMSYEEYLVYSSQEMPELLRKYSNFDEQLFLERYADEIEAALQKREEQLKQEENGKEGNVSAGEESGYGRSNQVQSGERTDDTGRGEVGKDSAGEVGPRHEGVVESEAALGSGGSTNQQRIGRVQKETRADVADQTMTHDEAIAFIAAMENRAEVAPSVDLSIENWDSLFGLDGIVNTPIGKVKMGDNQFTKMMREDRHGKLGMVKPTLENPDAILEDASKAKAGDTEERPSSYIFVKAFKKSDGSRYYYFTSITVSKDGLEVVVSNQEKRKNAIANLLSKDKLVWKHADDVSDASDVAQGLYSSQGNVSDLATEGTDAPQTSMSNNDPTSSGSKDTNNTDTKQENEEKSAGGEKEPMSPTPAMIDRMIEEQRVDDVSELLISSELKKAAEGIAEAFGMKVVYLKKVFIKSDDPAVEDFEGNGFVRNGVIYLSLKEADIAQFTFGHELLHQLKQIDADSYMRIRQKVIDVMGRKAFEMEVKARQMTYANVPGYTLFEDYAEEVIADTLGDIITHTDMLPNIARSLKDNPSLLDRFLKVVDNVRQYFRGKTGGALGDLVNDIRDTYEMTARQGAELGLSTPLKITEHTKFSLKDNQGNPLNQDGTLKLDKIKSVDELTDEDFLHPTRNVELPSLPKKIADAIGTEGKPVVIKKNIFERNYMRHKDVTPDLSKIIFKSALYNPDLYGQNQKKTRPYNWVLINTKDEKGNNRTVLLEVNPNKDNVEIVHWHFIDERGLKKIRKQVDREDGQLLILPSDKEEVGALSDPTVNLSAANIDNSSETAKESEGKDRQHYASLGVSRQFGDGERDGEREQQTANERLKGEGYQYMARDKFSLRLAEAKNNTDKNPSQAQKESGNYRKGHIRFGGYNYTIENPQGSYRSGVDENGKKWKQKMNNTYGYILGTKGKDGDHLDMFINDNADLDSWNGNVYVVDQVFPDGSFDEHKVMYGFDSEEEARKAYLSNYEQGWQGLGNITGVSKEDFDRWLEKSGRKTKAFSEYKNVKSESAESPKTGAFGTIYTQFKGKPQEAIAFLLEKKEGEAVGALHHKDIGDIDLVWGKEGTAKSDGFGLAKLAKYHPEVLGNLQEILDAMVVVKRTDNRVQLESETHQASVRLTWDSEKKNWLLTAFEKKNSVSDNTTDTVGTAEGGKRNDTATPQNTVSDGKDTIKPSNSQKKNVKSNKKTPFSLKNDRTLAGVHNITEEKLLKAIKQGGLANPSVAVIDSSKQNHDDYGDISLILPSDKVAKRTGKNAGTWQGDAWTPTYPQVERQMSNKGAEKASNDVSSVPGDMYSEVRRGLDRWLDGGEENSAMAYMFLHEKGVAPEPKKIQPKFSDEAYNELKSITAGNFNIYGIGKADARKVLDMYIDAKFDGDKDLYEEKTKAWLERNKSIVDAGANGGMRYAIAKENVELYDEYGFNYKGVQTFVRDVEYDHRKTGVDMNATLNEVEDYIKTNNLTDEFNTWMEGKEKEYGIKEVIFDGFTPSGNRRYVPNTLENVSEIMKKQGRNGSTGTSVSFQNFAARLMPSYGTLKDIRSKKGLLTSDREKLDKFREKWSNVFFELGMKCQPDATGTFDDYGLARLSEAAMTSDPQAYLKKEYNVDFSDEDTKRLKEMVKAIKEESPAMYFETKFERPVGFDEFSSAVVPTTASNEVKQALQNAGVQIYEYDKEKEGDRSRAFNEAINSSDNIRFSLDKDKGTVVSPSKPSKAEAVLRDAVIDRLRENGMEVINDVAEGQKVLDEANGKGKLQMGDAPETFAERQKLAVENRGVVMPGLNETYVEVVKDIPRHGYTGTIAEATREAIDAAKRKYAGKELTYNNYGVNFNYTISANAIEICLSPKHQNLSANKGIHLALAEHLEEVINNSIEVEEHPDYVKNNGTRGNNGSVNTEALMHRFYGVAVIDGTPFRIMTLMREGKDSATSNGIHSYAVQKIEVLDNDLPSTSNGVGSIPQVKSGSLYPLAKLLKGVEKAYDKGKYLLEESKKRSAGLREQRVYHGSGADGVRFFRTANGEAYGFTVGGRIYVDPRIATSETPVHEYAHLWASALRSGNAEEWQNVVGLMKDSKVWDEVKGRYPELKTDDEIADEVIATYSGRRGAERLREEQRKIAEGDGGVFEKAEAISALESVKRALKMFWKGVADFLHIHYKSAEEVADRVMKDLLEGVDPRKMGETKDGGVRFNAKQKRALETASLGNAPRSLTVVSSATGAKILNSIDKLVESLEKSATQPKTFIGNVAKALGASRFGSGSEYATFETKNGDIVTIRLANHNAHVSGFDHNGKDNGISIVISPKPNEGITNDGNAHITEFYYDSIKLRRADGKPLAEIVRSIKQALYSGEFKDTTGLAERQEVNGEDVIRYQFIGEKGAAEADHAEEVSVRLDNLSVAREMEAEKKDAKAIKMATGWERGADGKWRYEIADLKEFDRNGNLLYRKHHPDYARYIELQDKDLKNLLEDGEKLTDKEREEYEALSKKYESDKFGGEKLDNIHTLEAYVDAPELFKAYPELRNVRVTFKDTGGWETASYYAISDVIDFNVDDVGEIVVNTGKVTANMRTKELKSVFLHEIQHAIQVIEGFAEGGSPQYMKGLYSDYFLQDYSSSQLHELAELRRIAENKVKRGEYKRMSYAVKNVIKAAKEHGFYPTWAESFDNNPNSVTTVYDTLVKFPSEILDKAVLIDEKDLYRRVAGEVEARNVQERMGMSAEERRASLAAETEDVAREDQIFLMGNGVSEMGSRVGKRMAEIGEHYEDKALTDEERPIVDVFCGRNDNLKVSIERDGKSLVLMMRQGSENGAGTKHCLYRHYGTGVGYLTADDILKIPYIMANGFAKEKLRGKSRLVEYTYKDEQGCEYTLLTEKKKGFEIFNDFYTNRKASSLSTFNTSEDAHTGSDNALIGAKLGNVSETAKESEGKDRQHYASLGVSRSLDKEAGEGEPRWASLGLSEQQLDGDDTIRFSLNYDKWNREMASWLKRNRLPKNAQRPVVPQREAGESDLHFAGRLAKYNQDKALWNTAPKYEGHLSSGMTARGEFNYELQRGAVLKRIAIQDSMLAIRKAQEAIARHSGLLKVGTFEDAYMAENNSHGKAKNEFEQYDQEYLEPLRKWFNVMMKRLDGSYNNVTNYMIAKHGLERNAHMAFMAALEAEAKKAIGNTQPDAKRLRAQMVHDAYRQYKADSRRLINDADYEAGKYDYAQWRRTDDAIRKSYCSNYESFRYDKGGVVRDYSGLSSLFRNETDFEEKAAELCADIESKNGHETSELWDAVRQATRQILKNSHDAGMMSDETYDYVRGMYEHYIPLRGWNDSAADEVWDYAGGGRGVFNAALKEAHGRQSLADDPVAYIMNMAESGFLVNNRNWVKQHFLTMAMNHPSDLLTVSKAWYVKTKDQFGNEVWIPASPNIPADETDPAVIEAALDAFRTKMEQMELSGDATQQRGSLNIEYPQTKSEEREHEVRVMKDGEEYVVYVNGDPQLAQALNNTRAMRVREHEGNFEKACAWLGRKMAAVYTSLSPLFVPSNWARDTTMTLASTAIREDARYNWLLRTKFMRPDVQMRMFGLVKEYQNGKLREKVKSRTATKTEENFWNFMINGGETGFVSTMDVDAFREKIQRDLKDMGRTRLNPVKVGHTIADSVEYINRVIEDSNRFAIYQTSIEYGRGIEEAVQDAKNVTLNFNRKGTGEMGMSAIRQLYLFINPAIQSLQTLGALAKDHKAKFTAVTSAWMASGMLVPLFNELMFNLASAAAGGGGDDDDEFNPKEEYWKFSSFDRRNNCILWIPFTHNFIKIPLAPEFRGFYGIGDMVASAMWGGENAKESWSNYAADLMGQIIDLSPLDPVSYDGNVLVSLMPNAIRPLVEIAQNVTFTGKPIYRESDFNKYDPSFKKAYAGTPDFLLRYSKWMNSIGNKYPEAQQGPVEQTAVGRYANNPAVIDHLLKSYLGGMYTLGSQIAGAITKASDEETRKDFKTADIPFFSKFVANPNDRPQSKNKGDAYWQDFEKYQRTSHTLGVIRQDARKTGNFSVLEDFYKSEEYKEMKEYEPKAKQRKEEQKYERWKEEGNADLYQPHQQTGEDVYKRHSTPADDFEDTKASILYQKIKPAKDIFDLADINTPSGMDTFNKYYDLAGKVEEAHSVKKEMNAIVKSFVDGEHKATFDPEKMKEYRALRKQYLQLVEEGNRMFEKIKAQRN